MTILRPLCVRTQHINGSSIMYATYFAWFIKQLWITGLQLVIQLKSILSTWSSNPVLGHNSHLSSYFLCFFFYLILVNITHTGTSQYHTKNAYKNRQNLCFCLGFYTKGYSTHRLGGVGFHSSADVFTNVVTQ